MTLASPDPLHRYAAPAAVGRLQTTALVSGLVAAVVCVVGWVVDADQFFYSWLLGCLLWLGVSVGALALTMIHSLTGGVWGVPARRILEAAAGVLPLLLVLCLPLLAGIEALYPWAGPEAGESAMLAHKAPYLNEPFFVARFFVYFAAWIGLAWLMRRLSLRQDRTGDPKLLGTMAKVGAPGLVVWAFVTTFAYFDWLMSLEPLWFSTIYGVYFFGGAGISSLAFLILAAVWLARWEPMRTALAPRHLHDWGKLLFAFIMLWGYFSFSQFLIIWSGNLPEEIEWYLHRTEHGWRLVTILLVLFHFAVPFVLLLSRDLKKHARRLSWMAAFLLVMRWLDYLWQIAPTHHSEMAIHWLDVAAPVAVGGLWVAAFAWLLRRHPLLPPRDPYLEESIGEESHHGH
jgi:hypothetical protein